MNYRIATLQLLLSMLPAVAQTGGGVATNGQLNGRFWSAMEDQKSKTTFVIGAQVMLTGVRDKAKYDSYFSAKLNAREVADEVDKFYAQPENLPIPIIGAFMAVTLRAGGMSENGVNAFIDTMRSMAAKN
jgi:hypothetical protein